MNTKKILALGLSAIVVIAVIAGVYWYIQKKGAESAGAPADSAQTEILPMVIAEGVIGEGLKEYTNTRYHFSLQYPQELTVKEYKESSDSLSVSFENVAGDKGFQIFVTSYADTHITAQRFKIDEPSGIIKEPIDVVIGGVRATMFFSKNSVMGETREVWFIKGGFLYEVTTYADLDMWLANIMQTLKFI